MWAAKGDAWSTQNQAAAEASLQEHEQAYQTAIDSWASSVMSGGSAAQGQAATENVLRQWRADLEKLRDQISIKDGAVLDKLHIQVGEITEQKAVLKELQSRHGTAAEQASIVEPKARSSPYTNLLGLERVFKPSTRIHLIIAAVLFAVLALILLGWLVYGTITIPASRRTSFLAAGSEGGV